MSLSKRAPKRKGQRRGATPDEHETLAPVLEVRNNPLRGPSLYSVALSADGAVLAIGQSDGSVRIFDVGGGRAVRFKLRGAVTALVVGRTHAVAIAGGAEHRISLGTRAVESRTLLGAELAGAAMRGNRFAVGGDNVGSGRLEDGVDSYCGMPVAEGEVFGLVALSADGARVAAIRVPAHHPGATAESARLYLGSTNTGPGAASELLQWKPKPRTRSVLGFIGDRVVLAEASATSLPEPGADALDVSTFEGTARSVFAWPTGFRPTTVAICDKHVLGVGKDGRIARMAPDGACAIDSRRVEPWSMSSTSPGGERVALAYPYGASVYSLS
ncbi:MAG: hypothetical protein JNK04_24160 [Myxococcales bacterium]|nr:hypothetical protein [Myxococcales bacterium]